MTAIESERNKQIFAKNFNYYLTIKGKNQNDIVQDLKITASTVSDWANGKNIRVSIKCKSSLIISVFSSQI